MEAPSSLDADLFAEYEDEDTPSIADPLKPWNWVWFQFNDKLHLFILKPVSKGYGAAMPEPARKGLRNFFSNLSFPLRLVSSALQGRMGDAGRETGRFAVNTTLGVLGFSDPAKKWFGWEPAKRDFDQTFAKWGLGKGVYLTWPIFGPSSVRGTFALVGDLALDPATYLPGVSLINIVNSMSLGDDPYQTMREMALDPYVAVRNGYVQYRDKKAEQ